MTAWFKINTACFSLTFLCLFFFFCFKVAILTNDPLAWKGGLKARWAMAIHDAMEHIKENLAKIEWPFLVLHGDADQLTMVDGSVMLEEKAASQDKTIKVTFLGCLTYLVI